MAWRLAAVAASCLLGAAALLCVAGARPDEPAGDMVGVIDGESIAVQGPMKVDLVRGQVRTMLRSGSDVRVNSGQARIELVEGGAISICGPAHLSVLKTVGSLTVALDSGTMHAHIEREPALVVYTPQIQAKPLAVGGGPQDLLVGLEPSGVMCIRATSGAVRVEQQLTGQSVIVPQSADIQLLNGQFETMRPGGGKCDCELQLAKSAPEPKPLEASLVATAEEARRHASPPAQAPRVASGSGQASPPEKPTVKEEPVYQVFMPPLAFDASAKVQPEPDPKFILLVRRVRVRPTLIFRGTVEGEPAKAAAAAPSKPTNQVAAATPIPSRPANGANDSVVKRVRNFLRRIWNPAS